MQKSKLNISTESPGDKRTTALTQKAVITHKLRKPLEIHSLHPPDTHTMHIPLLVFIKVSITSHVFSYQLPISLIRL